MPEAFEKCYREGGSIVTVKVGKDKYRHVCKKGGESYYGHIKTKKKTSDKKND